MSLLRRIGAFLRRGHYGPPGPASSASSDSPVASFIPASSNPFHVDLWDCSAFTHTAIAVTSDPAVAERFGRLRQATGRELCAVAIAGTTRADGQLQYPLAAVLPEGPLSKAECMEDKWDIYHYVPHLYFARSWSGDLAYRAAVRVDSGLLTVESIDIATDESPAYARAVVDYLIKSHLFGAELPHPLPVGLPPEGAALFSMSMFGRRCAQGSYGDTTQLTLP